MSDSLRTAGSEGQKELSSRLRAYFVRTVLYCPLVRITFRKCRIGQNGFLVDRDSRFVECELYRYDIMNGGCLLRPCRTEMLRINRLYSHVDSSGTIRTQIDGISMLLAHVAIEEITPRTICISVRSKDIVSTRSSTDPQRVSEVINSSLIICAVAPCDSQLSVRVVEHRLCRSVRAHISNSTFDGI